MLYDVLAKNYAEYANTANHTNPKKMSLPKDALMRKINTCEIINDYSCINPISEAETYGAVTYKGPSGLNLDQSFTLSKRSFDKTMMGLVGMSSPYNSKVGITRQLAMNPRILNNRGYIKPGTMDKKGLNVANIMTPAEILTPFSANHDDPPRTAMVSGQSKHIIPVDKTDRLLIGNGSQRTLPHMIGTDFINIAKQDGRVVEIDKDSHLMVVKYKDGSTDICDLSPKVVKNGGGGFWVANTKVTDLKAGETFKKGEVLAKNPEYFKGKGKDVEYAAGNLTKFAIHSGYYTFEDATIVTEQLCKEMTSYITMKKDIILSPMTNIDHMVNIGDKIKTGDPLLIFEEVFGDADISALLDKMGEELGAGLEKDKKNYLKSKYTGVIEDIKIYYTVPEEELSPSLRAVITAYNERINKKRKVLNKYYDNEHEAPIVVPPSEMVVADNGRVKGINMGEGVMIEFFIKYADTLGLGDKISFFTALKSIISETIPQEYAPYSEHRPDEPINALLPFISVNARMTASIFLNMFGNKVLVELKHAVKDIYNDKK